MILLLKAQISIGLHLRAVSLLFILQLLLTPASLTPSRLTAKQAWLAVCTLSSVCLCSPCGLPYVLLVLPLPFKWVGPQTLLLPLFPFYSASLLKILSLARYTCLTTLIFTLLFRHLLRFLVNIPTANS